MNAKTRNLINNISSILYKSNTCFDITLSLNTIIIITKNFQLEINNNYAIYTFENIKNSKSGITTKKLYRIEPMLKFIKSLL